MHKIKEFVKTPDSAWFNAAVAYIARTDYVGDVDSLFAVMEDIMVDLILRELTSMRASRVTIVLFYKASNMSGDETQHIIMPKKAHWFRCSMLTPKARIAHAIHKKFKFLDNLMEDFCENGSGWCVDGISHVRVEFVRAISHAHNQCVRQSGDIQRNLVEDAALEEHAVDDPDDQQLFVGAPTRKAYRAKSNSVFMDPQVVDVHSTDGKCVLYAIAAHWKYTSRKYTQKQLENPSTYKTFIENNFETSNFNFPLSIVDLHTFIELHAAKMDFTAHLVGNYQDEAGTNNITALETIGSGKEKINILISGNPVAGGGLHAAYIKDFNKFVRFR